LLSSGLQGYAFSPLINFTSEPISHAISKAILKELRLDTYGSNTTDYFKGMIVVVIHYLILESIAVANKPTPKPAIKLPMKYKAD